MSPQARALAEEQVTQPVWTDAVVAAGTVGLLLFAIGFWTGTWNEQRKPKPAPQIIERVPLAQWACTKQEFREYQFACKQRVLSGLTKQKGAM